MDSTKPLLPVSVGETIPHHLPQSVTVMQQGLGTCGWFSIIHGLPWKGSKASLNPPGYIQAQTQLTVTTEVCSAQLGWPAKGSTGFWDLVLPKFRCTDLAHSLSMFQSFVCNLVMIILNTVTNQLYKMLWRCRWKASTLYLLLSIKKSPPLYHTFTHKWKKKKSSLKLGWTRFCKSKWLLQ